MRRKRTLMGTGAFALCLIAAYFAYDALSYVEEDFAPLEPYAKTQNLRTLIAAVQVNPPGPEGFRFVALGDTRSNINIAREVLTEVKKESPAFVLSNGDLVRRGRVEEYAAHHLRLVDLLAPIPMVPVPGNHEEGPNKDFAAYRYIYGAERFSFDYGDCRFVGVNNCDWRGLDNGDLKYLETELGKAGARFKFVVFHVPPRFLENAVESDEGRGFTWNAGRLRELMTRMKVDHVFVGHVHGFASEVVDGVRYTITGGAGANLADELRPEGRVHNYVVVHVRPDGLRNEVIKRVNGTWIRETIP